MRHDLFSKGDGGESIPQKEDQESWRVQSGEHASLDRLVECLRRSAFVLAALNPNSLLASYLFQRTFPC